MTEEQLKYGNQLMKSIKDYNNIMKAMQDNTLHLQCVGITIKLSEEEQAWMYKTLENRVWALRQAFNDL